MTMAKNRNPFIRNACGHCNAALVVPVGSFAQLDIFDALTTVDEMLEDGDVLAARQLLWSIGRTLYAAVALDTEEVDDLVVEHEVNMFIKELEAETGD
jgi:hypothetical protein